MQEKRPAPLFDTVWLSRADRLGDLVLSLPALGHLKRSQIARKIIIHTSRYARDIGLWAQYNNLCDDVWTSDLPLLSETGKSAVLSLFHCRESAELVNSLKPDFSLGPRSKISALWTYSKTISQKRSQVVKSEMEYNVDLVNAFFEFHGWLAPHFQGLPALQMPESFVSPETVSEPAVLYVISNRGSAKNLTVDQYLDHALAQKKEGVSPYFLAPDKIDHENLRSLLEIKNLNFDICTGFERISQLVAYLAQFEKVYASSTGPLHIAHALGIEVHGFYPSKKVQSFKRWRPCGYWHEAPVTYETI